MEMREYMLDTAMTCPTTFRPISKGKYAIFDIELYHKKCKQGLDSLSVKEDRSGPRSFLGALGLG